MDEKLKGLFGDDPVMFLKFSDNPKNLLSLQQGNVYMNNLKFFVDLEAETGIPGMGDKQEVLNVVNDVELSFYKQGTEDLAFKAKAKQITMRYEDALYKPVFCMFAVTVDMIKVLEESDKELKLAFDFSDELITKMHSEFGEHVLVISPAQFKNKIHKSFSEKNYDYTGKYVEYLDFNINEKRRMEMFQNQDIGTFFIKNNAFKHQNEFRIVIFNKDEENSIIEKIESLEDSSYLMKTEELFSKDKAVLTLHFK
ncbi:hypothetical protein OCA08_21520 [Bacillus cereus]|nr:hypothetical protein [Bacillus cereus]